MRLARFGRSRGWGLHARLAGRYLDTWTRQDPSIYHAAAAGCIGTQRSPRRSPTASLLLPQPLPFPRRGLAAVPLGCDLL